MRLSCALLSALGACCAQLYHNRKSSVTTGTLPSTGQPCLNLEFPCRDRSPLGLAKHCRDLKQSIAIGKSCPWLTLCRDRGPSPLPVSVTTRKSCRNINPFPRPHSVATLASSVATQSQQRTKSVVATRKPSCDSLQGLNLRTLSRHEENYVTT